MLYAVYDDCIDRQKNKNTKKVKSMKKLRFLAASLVIAGSVLFCEKEAIAQDTFDVRVYHGINGNSLGLSKALPVIANIELDGAPLAGVPLEFGDVVNTQLPEGDYLITIYSEELGMDLSTMTVGPVYIPAGLDVDLHAKLAGGKTPVIKVKIK